MARILIIEDDELVRDTLRDMLETAGHEVLEAADGGQGLATYRENPADVVITDIIMPDKEGVETIIELRRDYPDVKIIAISGGGRIGTTSFLELAREFGAQHAFGKPFQPEKLLSAIQDCLSGGGKGQGS